MSTRSDERPLSQKEMNDIRRTFEGCGYSVRPLDDESFEFTSEKFPLPTHVFATPFFLQFTSFSFAIPRLAKGTKIPVRDQLLNELNCATNLVKVTCDDQKISPEFGGWRFQLQAKLTSGVVRSRYSGQTVAGFVGLWLSELAHVIVAKDDFCEGLYRVEEKSPTQPPENNARM